MFNTRLGNMFLNPSIAVLCFVASLAGEVPTGTAIKIDSVADKYAMQNFTFEVNPETGRAGIRLEYNFPPALVGLEETGGPEPKIVTLPALTYDAVAHAVIYSKGLNRITCATAATHRTLFGKSVYMKPTGACIVAARLTSHSHDNGWSINRFRTLDIYFEAPLEPKK
jgi:hypothetical protein